MLMMPWAALGGVMSPDTGLAAFLNTSTSFHTIICIRDRHSPLLRSRKSSSIIGTQRFEKSLTFVLRGMMQQSQRAWAIFV
jgi:hypothetical protein